MFSFRIQLEPWKQINCLQIANCGLIVKFLETENISQNVKERHQNVTSSSQTQTTSFQKVLL